MGLNTKSSPIQISTTSTQAIANAFQTVAVDLQLNPLDQEVFVVTGVKIDFLGVLPFGATGLPVPILTPSERCSITTTKPSELLTIGASNCIAYADRQALYSVVDDGAGAVAVQSYAIIEQGPTETPEANVDYIAIIATSNFYVSLDSVNSLLPVDVAVRIYGFRAKADASTYAALVASEALSA